MDTSQDKFGARQFSLRKLLLWMGLVGVYLGVLQLPGTEPIPATVVTVWFAVILFARLCWGLKGGMIVVLVTVIVLSVVISLAVEGNVLYPTIWLFFAFYGYVALLLIHLLVHLVNWLESLGRKRRPPDS